MPPTDEELLENPGYASLCGPHARFAEVRGKVRRYAADVAPFLGLPLEPDEQDWRDAAALLEPGSFVAVRQRPQELAPGWQAVRVFELVQMVGEQLRGAPCLEAVALGAEDVPEMLALVAETEPGPFLARTVELGAYLGIRREGELVAMAGERFRFAGWTEISAVCTRASQRGQGLASCLMAALIEGIQARSERAFLHVLSANSGAIQLYEQLGFRVRATASLTVVTRA